MAAPVSAVIPNWNGEAHLGRMLESLQQQSLPPAQVIVVDNGSLDRSAEIAAEFGVDLIRLERNRGFAAAVNDGIRAARHPLVAILNNDVELEAEWLERLVTAMENPEFWFASGKILDMRDPALLDGAFDAVCRGACALRCGKGRADNAVWNMGRRVYFVPFTAVLFRKRIFDELGGLDEDFESYLEDIEFGFRCARRALSGIYVPEARCRHWGSATLGMWHTETVRRIARNQLLLVAKHFPRHWVREYGWPVLVAQLLWGIVALRHGAFFSYLRGSGPAYGPSASIGSRERVRRVCTRS